MINKCKLRDNIDLIESESEEINYNLTGVLDFAQKGVEYPFVVYEMPTKTIMELLEHVAEKDNCIKSFELSLLHWNSTSVVLQLSIYNGSEKYNNIVSINKGDRVLLIDGVFISLNIQVFNELFRIVEY